MQEEDHYCDDLIDNVDNMFGEDQRDHHSLFNELLFWVQEVGTVKKAEGQELFIKSEYCEQSLRDISKFLRTDDPKNPIMRRELGKWNFLPDSLLPLLVSQQKDKKLTFLTVLIMAELTYLPDKEATDYREHVQCLRKYKHAFLAPKVIHTLIDLLVQCLDQKTTEATEKNSQMIELIIVVFKNLVQIPKDETSKDWAFRLFLLQKFSEESVLDSFVYMTELFDTEFSKKLSFHFLEIFFHIFKDYSPCDFFELTKKQTLKDFMSTERKNTQKRASQRSTRHSRFGTCIVIKDKQNGTKKIVPGIPTSNVRNRDIGTKSAPKRKAKEPENPVGMQIHKKKFGENNIAWNDEEQKVKEYLKKMAVDFLERSFNPLIDVLLDSFYSNIESEEDMHEKYKYIKLASFFMAFCRLNAYEKLKIEKDKRKAKPAPERGPEPKLKIPASDISSALKLQNIDFVFGKGLFQSFESRKSARKMDLYLASVEYLLELLYIIKDMEKSDVENMVKSSTVLKQKLFTLQICELAKFGLQTYDANTQSKYFFLTVFRFMHVLLEMLEDYSKSKMLYIQTHKVRQTSKKANQYDDEEDALNYAGEQESQYIEKKFNFHAAVMEYANYEIITHLFSFLRTPQILDDEIIQAISIFINRVIRQVKATWIFYQLNTLNEFDLFLSEYRKELRYISIVNAIKMVLRSFFDKCKENSMLPLEIMFPFPNKETKDDILTNYEYRGYANEDMSVQGSYQDDDENELEIEEFKKHIDQDGWSDDQDQKLIEYYEIFKDDMKTCFKKVGDIINKYPEAVEERLKQKNLLPKKKKNDTIDSAFKEKEPNDRFTECKDAVKTFIRQSISKKVDHGQILESLNSLDGVVSKYLEFESSREKNSEFEM